MSIAALYGGDQVLFFAAKHYFAPVNLHCPIARSLGTVSHRILAQMGLARCSKLRLPRHGSSFDRVPRCSREPWLHR